MKKLTATFYQSKAGYALIEFRFIARGTNKIQTTRRIQIKKEFAKKNIALAISKGYTVIMKATFDECFK